MKPFSRKQLKADSREYSTPETSVVNHYIITHPDIMHQVIAESKEAETFEELVPFLTFDVLKSMCEEQGLNFEDMFHKVSVEELAQAWFETVKREETKEKTIDIENLPTLDKKKKLDDLLEDLSKETDPVKQEKIKQHITRIKNAKLLKADLWPGQAASENTLSHEWNSLSYNPLQEADTSVSGPRPEDLPKKSSPETDLALAMAIGEDIVKEMFFDRGIRWSQVVQFIKDQAPQLTDEDIVALKTDTKNKLEQYKIQVDSKKKGLSLADALKILETKEPKPVHVNYVDLYVELEDGSKLSFDETTRKALELSKSGSEESEEQERNKDAGTGFYDSPHGYDMGKRPQGDEFIWPADTWLPKGTEEQESEPWDNIAAFSKKELNKQAITRQYALYVDGRLAIRTLTRWKAEKIVKERFPEQYAKGNYEIREEEYKVPAFSKKAFLKISKPESGYVDNGVGYTCGRCAYFNYKEGKCALVQGEIKAQGCCNYWDDKAQLKQEGAGYTKEEAVYVEYPNVDYRCDECVFFDGKAKTCTKVEGEISPTASCNLWQPISKKESSLNKKANPPSRFWIAPDGKEFPVHGSHGTWIQQDKNLAILKSYGIKNLVGLDNIWKQMMQDGWIRISNEPAGEGFQIEAPDLHNLPSYLDDFVARNFKRGDDILIGNGYDKGIFIDDPFPSIQKAVNKALRNPVNAMLKKADVSGKQINDILKLIQSTGGATYNIQQGNLVGQEAFAVSTHKNLEQVVDKVDYNILEDYIVANQDLLNDPKNSFGAWSHNNQVYFDIVSTVSSKEEALRLAWKNNQLAIFDLRTMTEVPVGIGQLAFSKKDIIKKAEDSPLTTDQEDQIAASTSPVYNIALNNFASAVKRGHSKDRALAYAIDSVKNLEKIDPKKLVELANAYLKGLV